MSTASPRALPTSARALPMFDPSLLKPALGESIKRLSPRAQWRNPVMFVVWIGSALTSFLGFAGLFDHALPSPAFTLAVAAWLWLTVWFANLAESLAEGRGKAQAASLRAAKKRVYAKALLEPRFGAAWVPVSNDELTSDRVVLVEAGDTVPADGEVIEGVASVDESAITGESAPVIRESGGDRSAVTGGTKVLSDWIVVRVTAKPGEAFLDRMIAMVESAKRARTPNEIALTILLVALTLVFLVVCVTLLPYSLYSAQAAGGRAVSVTVLVALLVCLIPTTIGALLSAIGIAGMSRMLRANVIATSGRAVEAAGDVDVLLLDKTGTITLGNRQATVFHPAPGVTEQQLAEAAQLASLADETPEGRSVVVLAKQYGLRGRELHDIQFVAFSARTRMSGVDAGTRHIRKGATDAIAAHVQESGGRVPDEVRAV
ncbi:MAG TPA: potassium-transporting ATPase subunit KdpB, partial [Rhodanobacteraceae bacterium]|nr:potassium-transporting ATPase subunit KdpB [Rhodanobacteraceae bacterium]